ncbi:hypothetical protein B0A69_15655 [Chryseobacterium shigense]|uniref:Uncharacterized protein n=1 Tax=Chryseobacterium shigense TaxID=297244 RepID=A0A1N7IST1_9FLAO|nr:hypothetical protein [Chryseobacterium shigense]PQA92465.1 hypothetical protein B0A69_15655 [Chryseobacterium shigense]SIS40142.1 hypothetical protein SAMN05421639_104519 [Chryseobacterium shigense]
MKLKIIILLFTFSLIKIFATGQEPDKIIINNKEYDLMNNPLEGYLEKHPDDHPVYGSKLTEFHQYKNGERMLSFSSSNDREYIATFKIENNILSLIDIKIQDLNSDNEDYISVFQKLFGDRKIVLHYSGVLVIPTGKLIEAASFGYSSLHEQYKLMTIDNDTVVREKSLDKDEFIKFKFRQFAQYKKTEEYKIGLKKYREEWEYRKKMELAKENTKGMSKKEITALKKEYDQPPTEDYINGYFFATGNPDFVIVDY